MYLTYNNSTIEQREFDNYVNLTQMAKAHVVRLDNYFANKATKQYLQALENSPEFRGIELIHTTRGQNGGTFAHPLD